MRRERIAAPALTLLLVVSLVGGAFAPAGVSGPVGTVEAQAGDGSGGPCGAAEWFLTLASGTLLTTDCSTGEEVAQEWNESDAKQTRTQIHSQAGQLGAGNEQFLIGMDNTLTDSNTIAFSKGEAAAVETLANGGTVSEAQAAANESIENYYTTKQRNLLDRWGVSVQTVATLNARAENTTGVDDNFVNFEITFSDRTPVEGHRLDGTGSKTVGLVNGSNQQIDALTFWASISSGSLKTASADTSPFTQDMMAENDRYNNDSYDYLTRPDNVNGTWSDRLVVSSTDNLTSKDILVTEDWTDQWLAIEQRSQSTKEEVSVYVNDSLAPAVESGNLNATSYVSPATLAQEYSQSYNGSRSYIRATAIAAYSGMDAPDLEQTGSMTVTHDGTTYEGLLLSQQAPENGWQSGEQYDPALLSGLQMFAVAGQNSSVVELDGPFTVDSISGTDGEEIQSATTYNITYQTSNESANYTQLQQQIRDLNQQIEERQAAATSGGSSTETNTDGLLESIAAALGVSAGAAVVVVAGVGLIAVRIYTP